MAVKKRASLHRKLDFPLTPMVIGLVLGSLCEKNMRRALILSKGDWTTFVSRPISLAFIIFAVFTLLIVRSNKL